MAAFAAFIFFGSSIWRPNSLEISSTQGRPQISVAVVITGRAPVAAAISFARELAPPRWPERRLMLNCPLSSTTTTAGSRCFAFTRGAMALTAIPVAEIKTTAEDDLKASAAFFLIPAALISSGDTTLAPIEAFAIPFESLSPLAVTQRTIIPFFSARLFNCPYDLFEFRNHYVEELFALRLCRLAGVPPYSARPVFELVLHDERPREGRVLLF